MAARSVGELAEEIHGGLDEPTRLRIGLVTEEEPETGTGHHRVRLSTTGDVWLQHDADFHPHVGDKVYAMLQGSTGVVLGRLGQAHPPPRPDHWNTGNTGELVTTMPVASAASQATKLVIYSQEITDLVAGDLIVAMAEFELTNDLGYNVGVWAQLQLCASADAVVGTELSETNGFNISPDMHHATFVKVGSLQSAVSGTRYVNVISYAAASLAVAGHELTVEQDYGRLTVLRWRS